MGTNHTECAPCTNRMGALEKSNRGFAETSDKEVVRPELGTTFDSLTEVYDFYNM